MAILEVFGMDRSRGESVWVELERYGALVNMNHGNLSARRIRDQLTNSGNHNLGLPPEAPTMPRGLVLVVPGTTTFPQSEFLVHTFTLVVSSWYHHFPSV